MVRPSLWGRSGGQRSPIAARKYEKACSMLHQQHPLPPINWGTSSFWSRLSPHNLAFTSGLKSAPPRGIFFECDHTQNSETSSDTIKKRHINCPPLGRQGCELGDPIRDKTNLLLSTITTIAVNLGSDSSQGLAQSSAND